MAWDIDGYEALSFLAGLIMGALAIVLLRANRQRAQNRWLVGLLVSEMVTVVASASISFLFPTYLGFLSTLGTSISRLLRRPIVRVLPWASPAAALFLLAFNRPLLVARPDPTAQDIWGAVSGPLFLLYQASFLLAAITGLAVALLYWRGSPRGTSMRRQGAVFALAFGLHDGGMIVAVVAGIVGSAIDNSVLLGVAYYGVPLSKLVLLSLVTYGILRVQLFDIDLKIKWTLGRGTALTLLTGTFFVITETIEFFLPGEGLIANLGGASIVAVLIRPAWRLGAHFANALLPGIVETEEFRHRRRLEVYRASLESVAADGLITERERRILETMRTKLSISRDDANRIETALLQNGAKTPNAGTAASPPA